MKYVLSLLLILQSIKSISQKKIEFRLSPSIGISNNKTSWSISGDLNGNNPDYLSELVWRNVNFSYGLQASITLENLSLNMSISSSRTFKGIVSDIDYTANGRTGINYHEQFSSNNSNFRIIQLLPQYELYKNKLFVNVGYNHISSNNIINHNSSINSTYKWYVNGLQIGFKYNMKLFREFNYNVGADLLFSRYYAKADWKLRNDLKHPTSFDQIVKFNYGFSTLNSLSYSFNEKYSISLINKLLYSIGYKGVDKAYLKSGGTLFTQVKYNEILIIENYLSLTVPF